MKYTASLYNTALPILFITLALSFSVFLKKIKEQTTVNLHCTDIQYNYKIRYNDDSRGKTPSLKFISDIQNIVFNTQTNKCFGYSFLGVFLRVMKNKKGPFLSDILFHVGILFSREVSINSKILGKKHWPYNKGPLN